MPWKGHCRHWLCKDGDGVRHFSAIRNLISSELRRLSPDSVVAHPPDVCCRLDISCKKQQKARNICKPLVSHVCSVILGQLKKKNLVSPCAPMASSDAEPRLCEESSGNGEAGRERKSSLIGTGDKSWERQCSETRFCIRSPFDFGEERETEDGNGSFGVAEDASLEQVINLKRELPCRGGRCRRQRHARR